MQRVLSELHELKRSHHPDERDPGWRCGYSQNEDYVISGERNLLYVNDLSSTCKNCNLFNVFEQKLELLDKPSGTGVHIFIGNESGLPG